MRRVFLGLVTLGYMLTAAPPLMAQQAYELTDLGTLGGTMSSAAGINSAGQVVGSSTTAGDLATHAFLFSQGTMTDLGTLGGAASQASGINDSAQVVGSAQLASGVTHATLWNGATPTDLDPQDSGSSYASAISNSGDIVGGTGSNAAIFLNGMAAQLQGLPSALVGLSGAYAVNNNFQVAGYDQIPGQTDAAVTWLGGTQPSALSDLTGFPTLVAYGINDSGTIVGQIGNVALAEACLWNTGTSLQIAPQVLTGPVSAAYGINSGGLIVGTSQYTTFGGLMVATLWTSGGGLRVNLNATLRPQVAAAYALTQASAINAAGQIAANGTVTATGASHAFLLTPVASAGAPTATLTTSSASVSPGQSFGLTWSSTNAWACVAGGSGPNGAPWSGILDLSGTRTITAGASTGQLTATVTCSFGNQSAVAQAVVTVAYPPVSVTLSASPTTIGPGQSTMLAWTSANATSCKAGGGASGDGWSGTSQPPNGTAKVTEAAAPSSALTLTFTLSCTSSSTHQSAVGSAKVVEDPPNSSGGGAFDIITVLALALLGRRRTVGLRSRASYLPRRRSKLWKGLYVHGKFAHQIAMESQPFADQNP